MTKSITRESILRDYVAASERGQPYTWFNYQPINLPGYEATLPLAGRDCFDRAGAIAQTIDDEFRGRSIRVIDWGCNLGFFAFELAARGHDVVGVDVDRRTVDVCRYLSENSGLAQPPRFFCDRLDENSVQLYGDFDAAICLSVLHHIRDNRQQVMAMFSDCFPRAFIEMDGREFGRHELSSFYWNIREVAECHDRYGAGTRQRRTWFCDNLVNTTHYKNLKRQNIVGGRGVFRTDCNGVTSVIKRESLSSTHTWIRTDLRHELDMYRAWSHCPFFADLISCGEDERDRWIECEYVANDATANMDELRAFFRYLADNRLFLLDVSRDAFLFHRERLKVVDLESLFPLTGSVAELVRQQTFRPGVRLDTYQKQLDYIAGGIVP